LDISQLQTSFNIGATQAMQTALNFDATSGELYRKLERSNYESGQSSLQHSVLFGAIH
jgi:hypothetical protein